MNSPFGVYVHVPFCAAKCDYCAFATWTDRDHLIRPYLDALEREVAEASAGGLPPATSVFVGGGTPTRVPPGRLADIVASIPLAPGAEVTVECNPDDVSEPMLRTFVDAGVNRVSLGVQSMVPHVLRSLGRTHDPENVERAVTAVRAVGLPTFNLDLIYGAAGETLDDWEHTLVSAIALDPPHVSAYGLTVEAGTALADDPARHPDDDHQADEYDLADERLGCAGLGNYEVSNWARPGHESAHNRLYWEQGDYRGFGCAAHSHERGRRWWNVRTPDRYVDAIERGTSVVAASEDLDDATRRVEGHQLALRTRDGVRRDAFAPGALDVLDGLVRRHPLDETRVVLTRRGRLMANAVSMHLDEGTTAGDALDADRRRHDDVT